MVLAREVVERILAATTINPSKTAMRVHERENSVGAMVVKTPGWKIEILTLAGVVV